MRTRTPRSRSSAIKSLALVTLIFVLATGFRVFKSDDVQAQEKSLVWERFDVDIDVNVDSSFDVTEGQAIRFTQGTFRFGTRYIPISNFDYIDNWAITDGDGNVYAQTYGDGGPYTFSVEQSSSRYDIRWNFPPISNSSAVYYLSYTVHGGLRFYDDGDQTLVEGDLRGSQLPGAGRHGQGRGAVTIRDRGICRLHQRRRRA